MSARRKVASAGPCVLPYVWTSHRSILKMAFSSIVLEWLYGHVGGAGIHSAREKGRQVDRCAFQRI